MSEEPKSIWKKSWTGWAWLWAWLALVVATFLVVLIVSLFIPGRPQNVPGWQAASYTSIGIGVIGGICVGLLGFIHWLCSWKNFRRFLFGCACLVTLIALAYAEEDWRGWHDWNQFKHQWEAKGEKFGWQSIVPPPVPDDQNFAFSPVWMAEIRSTFRETPKRAEAWYGSRIYSDDVSKLLPLMPVTESGLVGTNWMYKADQTPENPGGNWVLARLPDLKPWQAYYRGFEKTNPTAGIPIAPQPQSPAQDVLLALSKFDPVIEQLRQDSTRPYSRFPLGYNDEYKGAILLPHLAAVKRCSMVLRLRAIAELQNNESDKALDDVKLSLRLVDAVRTEPFLISHLVRIAVLEITLQPIYEGLANHQWSDAQLAELDAELVKLDFLADYRLAMRGEMGLQGGNIDYFIQHRRELFNQTSLISDNGGSSGPPFVSLLIPTGWFYQNRLNCARMMVEHYVPLADVNQEMVSPPAVRHAEEVLRNQTRKTTPYNILEKMLLPALGGAIKKFAYAQSSVNLARVAIALERYRLAHGGYPESLDALAPQLIEKVPHDVIGGGPLHYRLEANGQFVLYSIGWNERDDGGVVVLTKGATPVANRDEGDWVWRYPAKN